MRDTVQLRLALAWQIGTKIANAESSNAAVVDNTGGQNTKDRGDDRTGQDRTRQDMTEQDRTARTGQTGQDCDDLDPTVQQSMFRPSGRPAGGTFTRRDPKASSFPTQTRLQISLMGRGNSVCTVVCRKV